MADGRITVNKLNDIMKESFRKMEESFLEINGKNNKINSDILEMKDQIIKNLVESNEKLQKKVENLKNE